MRKKVSATMPNREFLICHVVSLRAGAVAVPVARRRWRGQRNATRRRPRTSRHASKPNAPPRYHPQDHAPTDYHFGRLIHVWSMFKSWLTRNHQNEMQDRPSRWPMWTSYVATGAKVTTMSRPQRTLTRRKVAAEVACV